MKILEELKNIEDFSDLLTIKKIEGDHCSLTYLNFKLEETKERKDGWSILNEEPYVAEILPEITTILLDLKDKINLDLIKKSFIKNVKELSGRGKDEMETKKISMEHVEEIGGRKAIYAKIVNASNYIATYGRIGFATHMLISKENFEKYEISKFEQLKRYEVILDDNVDDIYLYKKNEIDQQGIVLIYNNEKFSFKQIGSNPNHQFIKVTLRK